MTSLKTKLRLSTALAFSAAVGMSATTLLIPAVSVAQENTGSEAEYETLEDTSKVDPELLRLYPKQGDKVGYFAGNFMYRGLSLPGPGSSDSSIPTRFGLEIPEGTVTWSRPTGDKALPPEISLDEKTGEVKADYFVAHSPELSTDAYSVYAHVDGRTFEVPVWISNKSDRKDQPKLGSCDNSLTAPAWTYQGITGYLGRPPIDTGDHPITPSSEQSSYLRGATFEFDKDSDKWKPYMEVLTIEPDTGIIHYNNIQPTEEFTNPAGAENWSIPVKAHLPEIKGDEDQKITCTLQILTTYANVFSFDFDENKVDMGKGEEDSYSVPLHYRGSDSYFKEILPPEFFENAPEAVEEFKEYRWSDGTFQKSLMNHLLNTEMAGMLHWENPDLPDWVTWDDEKKVLTANPPADLEPGDYTFEFKYRWDMDDHAKMQYEGYPWAFNVDPSVGVASVTFTKPSEPSVDETAGEVESKDSAGEDAGSQDTTEGASASGVDTQGTSASEQSSDSD